MVCCQKMIAKVSRVNEYLRFENNLVLIDLLIVLNLYTFNKSHTNRPMQFGAGGLSFSFPNPLAGI